MRYRIPIPPETGKPDFEFSPLLRKKPHRHKKSLPVREGSLQSFDRNNKDYSLASAFFASAFFSHGLHAFSSVQVSHFFSALQHFPSLPQHSAFSAFLSAHPQLSQANAMEPAIISAIATILIIFFMLDLLLLINQPSNQ
jgi:hypothetical protein